MSFKTNAFTVMEYSNMDLIVCVEYEDINNSNNKYLKVIISREYDSEMINIFNLSNIPDNIKNIYEFSKKHSFIKNEDDMYVVYGMQVHKNNNKYKRILFKDDNPLEQTKKSIDDEKQIGDMTDEEKDYYATLYNSIKNK